MHKTDQAFIHSFYGMPVHKDLILMEPLEIVEHGES